MPSLRARLLLLVFGMLVVTGALGMCGSYWYSHIQNASAIKTAQDRLLGSAKVQADVLLVSFLIPEQHRGLELELQNIREDEELMHAQILQQKDLLSKYSHCTFGASPTACLTKDQQHIVVFAPIREGGIVYGYLVKVQEMSSFRKSFSASSTFVTIAIVLSGILILLLLGMLWLSSGMLPHAIHQIEEWLDGTLQGSSEKNMPAGRFSELHGLAMRAKQMIESHRCTLEENAELRRSAAVGALAAQVSHDIRSPLTALKIAATHLAEVPEERRLMVRHAVQRIEDIINELAEKQQSSKVAFSSGLPVQLLSSLIEPLISEKRLQVRHRPGVSIVAPLEAATYACFAAVEPVAFKRVLSNLINNAIEAFTDAGTVTCTMAVTDTMVILQVIDDGPGIPSEILPRLTQRGATFGKIGGSGLGLYHARRTLEAWGGTLVLASTQGKGTTVTVALPSAMPPNWFVPELVIPAGTIVVMVDDDPSIHQVWTHRLQTFAVGNPTIFRKHFSNGTEVVAWYRDMRPPRTLFLCDYELCGEPSNGLDLIQELDIANRAILVTSHYDEHEVRSRCAELGVRLIPKGLAGIVPLRIVEARVGAPAVEAVKATCNTRVLVIDDDESIRFSWELMRERLQIGELVTFSSMEECEASGPSYAAYDYAFVDKQISQTMWRVDQVIEHLKTAGVKRVYVASGESTQELAVDPACALADGFVAPLKIPMVLPA